MATRYRLDDLGWCQFEELLQALLKAELGLGVESWGGRGDWGRDAYFGGPLAFPTRARTRRGPFLFQVKFVEGANAAGAQPRAALLNALNAECAKLRKPRRKRTSRRPRHYAFWTNSPLTPELRKRATSLLRGSLPKTSVYLFGGKDVCDLLDKHEGTRRSFPQILSLRDLNDIISSAVNKESLERSRIAIESARDLVPVFVPTEAYSKCWECLRKHHFAVLEGPPEMGKTAIAWMVSFLQFHLEGWQAIACDDPGDFLKLYDGSVPQAFVADDAFGRIDYVPSRGFEWEKALSGVLRRLDSKHWFLWTSRKNILERAMAKIDPQSSAKDFPKAAALLVDANALTTREKALILYKHARGSNLEEPARLLVRHSASEIVTDSHFTPERIRRFVTDYLPDLATNRWNDDAEKKEVQDKIRQAIQSPSESVRKSFRALPESHKWFLIAFLVEGGWYVLPTRLAGTYERYHPCESEGAFPNVLSELEGSFVKVLGPPEVPEWLEWMHPSYGDVVLEELADKPELRSRFLRTGTLGGVKFALRYAGSLRHPVVSSDEEWELLRTRVVSAVDEASVSQITDLLDTVSQDVGWTYECEDEAERNKRNKLCDVVISLCDAARKKWDRTQTALTPAALSAYCWARGVLPYPRRLPRLPELSQSWEGVREDFAKHLAKWEQDSLVDPDFLNEWVSFHRTLRDNDPSFLRHVGFPYTLRVEIQRLVEIVEGESDQYIDWDSADEIRNEAERQESLAKALRQLAGLLEEEVPRESLRHLGTESSRLTKLADKLDASSAELDQQTAEKEPEEARAPEKRTKRGRDEFDIEALFSDL